MGYLQGGKGINGRGGKVGEVGGFALRYKEERRKVGGRSLPIFKGARRLGPAHWQAQRSEINVCEACSLAVNH
jgi:hypothetical protein